MIQIEDVTEIPEFLWHETSCKEFDMFPPEARKELIRRSEQVKLIHLNESPLIVAGTYRQTFLSTPWLWLLLTKEAYNLKPSSLRALLTIADHFIPTAETLVEEDNPPAFRLAALFKFTPTKDLVLVGDKEYRVYRRSQWGS